MKKTYEQMIAELREIMRKIDDTSTSLDETIILYEQGMNLIKACEKVLDGAELKISELTRT
ncbi:MAG: exodeoxyribonuclease VII small subunit [Methanomicrobiales archaeon]|nr:exodeoxyribonuclease VII small subunit [Methanomicrobiales archaeon]